MSKPAILCENLVKIYQTKDTEVIALQGLDLEVQPGELTAIVGNSGSGKSTLLNIISGLDKPSAGKLTVNGNDVLRMTEKELLGYTQKTVGFIWQNNARNLIPFLTALENVELPMVLIKKTNRRNRAAELLDLVGLAYKKDSQLNQLSGGEAQRVAIAIALSNSPQILLGDEPTGSLDVNTMRTIMEVFQRLNKELGLTIVLVTHDRNLCKMVDRVVVIRDGRTSSEFIRSNAYASELKDLKKQTHHQKFYITSSDESHDEFVVLDNAGRLQLPQDIFSYLNENKIKKLSVKKEKGKILLKYESPEKD